MTLTDEHPPNQKPGRPRPTVPRAQAKASTQHDATVSRSAASRACSTTCHLTRNEIRYPVSTPTLPSTEPNPGQRRAFYLIRAPIPLPPRSQNNHTQNH